MKKLDPTVQTCLIIVKNLNESGDQFELACCLNYTNSMIYEFEQKLPQVKIYNVDTYEQAMTKIVDYEYAVITVQGSYIETYNIGLIINRMIDSNIALVGHILHKNDYYELHDQCFVINVHKWLEANKPHIRKSVANKAYAVNRDPGNIHDDYTPRWINAQTNFDDTFLIPVESSNLGSELISEFIGRQYNISAFVKMERGNKYYLYGGTEWFYQALFETTNYAVSNESLDDYNGIDNDHEQYFGIASPYFILIMHYTNPKCKLWNIFDIDDIQLLYCKFVLENLPKYDYDIKRTFAEFNNSYPWVDSFETADVIPQITKVIDYLQDIIKPYDLDDLGEIKYTKKNLWADQSFELENKKTLVYTSNIFRYPPASKFVPLSKQKKAQTKFFDKIKEHKYIRTIINEYKVTTL